jgi:hypothetical protein
MTKPIIVYSKKEFDQVVSQAREESKKIKARLRETYDSHADVQRANMRPKDEMTARAVDQMTKNIKDFSNATGKDISCEKAQEKAREIARKAGVSDA